MVKFSFPDYLFFLICLQRLDIYIKKLKQVYLYPFSGNSFLQEENRIKIEHFVLFHLLLE